MYRRIFRNKLVFILSLLLFCSYAYADHVSLKHLKGSVYVVEDYYYGKENSVVYIGENEVTIIGATWTPDTARLLADEIRKVTAKPITEVIVTNYHPDRAGGSAYWKTLGAKIIATELTKKWLKEDWQGVLNFTRQWMPDYPDIAVVMPDVVYPGDFQLQDGKIRTLYLGPSHTEDGIFVYFPQEKILYGNCILKEELGNLSYANLAEYPETLKKLKALTLPIDTVIAGHMHSVHGIELIDHYLGLLEEKKNNKK